MKSLGHLRTNFFCKCNICGEHDTSLAKMKAEISRIEGHNITWVTLRASYSNVRLHEEDFKQYMATVNGIYDFITMVNKAYTTVSELETRKAEIFKWCRKSKKWSKFCALFPTSRHSLNLKWRNSMETFFSTVGGKNA